MDSGTRASFSLPSIVAIVAALLSFTSSAMWGLILALVAIAFGVFGVLLSLAPSVRGGFVSILSLCAGVIGIIAALVKALHWL